MSVQVGRITWRFSNVISQEELESTLLSVEHAFIGDEARLSLGEEPVVFNIADSDDVERAEEFLANRMSMHGTQFQRKMASVLSRPNVSDEYFMHAYASQVWPLPDLPSPPDYFHRYVTLLNSAVRSAPWFASMWPHGRYWLIDVDGNFGAKVLDNLVHSFRNFGVENHDPFQVRRLAEDLVVFGSLLNKFKDKLSDELWTCWLLLVNSVRTLVEAKPLKTQLYKGVDETLASYFGLRGIERRSRDRESGVLAAESPASYVRHIGRRAVFWDCLESSIKQSIPSWAANFTENGQRLAGLVMAAVQDDPFASRFVAVTKSGFDIPCVEATFDFFDAALGVEEEVVSRAFGEVDAYVGSHEFRTGRPFFFNT